MAHFRTSSIGRSASWAITGAWLLAGTLATAQPAASPPPAAGTAHEAPAPAAAPDSITVTGNPERKAIIKQMTRALSRAHDRQLARFDNEVCFQVEGVNAPYDRIMAERMEHDARDAGVAVGKPGCKPNIVVVLADHVQADLQQIAKEGRIANRLGLMDKDLMQAAQGPGPAYVVTVTEQRGRDGEYMRPGAMSGFGDKPMMNTHESSIINPATRQDIDMVLVGIETGATMGKTLGQLADYAVLRALADIRGSAVVAGAEPSILGLFSGSPAIPELTSYDRAYLKGLYHGPAAMTAATQMNEIVTAAMKPAP